MRNIVCTIALSLSAWSPAIAQPRPRPAMADSSVPAIMARAARGADNPSVLAVLRNPEGRYSRAKQDMIADSLIGRAISSHATFELASDTAAYGAAVRAVVTLGHAGMSRYAGMDDQAGPAYSGGLDGLIRIHRGASVRQIRSRALSLMLRQPDRQRALNYARQVAQSPGDDGYDAAFVILHEATGLTELPPPTPAQRDEALGILRELNEKHMVRNPLAASKLPEWIRSVKP